MFSEKSELEVCNMASKCAFQPCHKQGFINLIQSFPPYLLHNINLLIEIIVATLLCIQCLSADLFNLSSKALHC